MNNIFTLFTIYDTMHNASHFDRVSLIFQFDNIVAQIQYENI